MNFNYSQYWPLLIFKLSTEKIQCKLLCLFFSFLIFKANILDLKGWIYSCWWDKLFLECLFACHSSYFSLPLSFLSSFPESLDTNYRHIQTIVFATKALGSASKYIYISQYYAGNLPSPYPMPLQTPWEPRRWDAWCAGEFQQCFLVSV